MILECRTSLTLSRAILTVKTTDLEVRMSVIARMRCAAINEIEGYPMHPDHFEDNAECRSADGGYNPDKCDHRQEYGTGRIEVLLRAVSDNRGINAAWAEATPLGALNLTINNPDAFGQFEAGAEYAVTIQKTRK